MAYRTDERKIDVLIQNAIVRAEIIELKRLMQERITQVLIGLNVVPEISLLSRAQISFLCRGLHCWWHDLTVI